MTQQADIEFLEMEDPTFEAGSIKAASARLTNLSAKQFTYSVELYLGVAKVATSGVIQVILPANSYLDVLFSIPMPLLEGTYPVFLDVWEGTTLLKHYQATEDVIITISPIIDVGPITWV